MVQPQERYPGRNRLGDLRVPQWEQGHNWSRTQLEQGYNLSREHGTKIGAWRLVLGAEQSTQKNIKRDSSCTRYTLDNNAI